VSGCRLHPLRPYRSALILVFPAPIHEVGHLRHPATGLALGEWNASRRATAHPDDYTDAGHCPHSGRSFVCHPLRTEYVCVSSCFRLGVTLLESDTAGRRWSVHLGRLFVCPQCHLCHLAVVRTRPIQD
jgi:hypothetical protein